MVSDVMSLIPIHEETFARDTENLHCFVPRYFSPVFCSAILFSSLSFGRSLSSDAFFCPASSVQEHVSALFIQTIART